MKHLPLLWANLARKKTRTLLTLASFAVAVFLFCLLLTLRSAFNQGVEAAAADRLFVINRVSLIQPLPISHRQRIERVPGVAALSFASWFGGVYQDERNFFPQFAIDAPTYLDQYAKEFRVAPEEWQAFLADKAGAVAGAATARRFGWKVGDRIPIRGTIYEGLWEFNLRGVYHGRRPNDDETQFWFRQDFLRERAPEGFQDYVGWYIVRVAAGADSLVVGRAIDAAFANSAWETRTQTESALAASYVKQLGNIELLMLTIGAVVVFTLLLVTGNTLSAAVRERTAELAVLKTLGYTDGFVMALVLAEAGLLATAGGGLGVLLAKLFTLGGDPTKGLLASFHLSTGGMAAGFGTALVVGLLAGLMPAWAALRLQVVQALRRV
jgi:putative ABC transport system permease protein